MSIEVNIPPHLAAYTREQLVAKVEGKTVGECLDDLVKQFPDIKPVLFDRNGQLYRYFDIYVNGESAYPQTITKPVKDGDKLHLVMIIAGG
jgi:molybdopterin converting factor small subunit